jgi:DNA-binding NarL/FixJ family response regulator
MRVVIADDAVLLREGASRLLEEAGHDVVAQAGDADDLLRKVRAHRPDVAVIDVRMPADNSDDGLRAALAIRAELPEVGILLLSQYVEDRYLGQLLARGANGVGYLLKNGWRTSNAWPRRSSAWRSAARTRPRGRSADARTRPRRGTARLAHRPRA